MGSETEERLRRRFFGSTDYHTIPGGRKKLEYLFSVLWEMKATRLRMKVLDVGCGNGAIAFAVASLGCEVLGIDVDESSIEHARRVNRFPNARFAAVSDENFDLREKYDLIICSEVLEHLQRPGPLLKTIVAHMKDDGLLLVTVPNGYGPREVFGRAEKFMREKLGLGKLLDRGRVRMKMLDAATKCAVHTSNPDQDHVQKFTLARLKELMEKAGLRVIQCVKSIFLFSVVFRTRSGAVDRLDGRVADYLPRFMASGWFLLCRRGA
jgi:2-polyprenyl-3-methyl-5-hydroxy-6-metoxy-1,4-benzoquinol methylase